MNIECRIYLSFCRWKASPRELRWLQVHMQFSVRVRPKPWSPWDTEQPFSGRTLGQCMAPTALSLSRASLNWPIRILRKAVSKAWTVIQGFQLPQFLVFLSLGFFSACLDHTFSIIITTLPSWEAQMALLVLRGSRVCKQLLSPATVHSQRSIKPGKSGGK